MISSPTAFDIQGPVDAPWVTLVHGIGLSREIWADHVDDLSRQFRVLNYDLWGHGRSGPLPAPASLSLYSMQLIELLDHLRIERTAIVGFSLGGMINRRVVLDEPSRVSALAILNSPHRRNPEAQALVEQRAAATADGDLATTLDATLARWFTPAAFVQQPDLVSQVRQWILSNDLDSFAQARQVLARGVTELIAPEPPITVATLVLTGEHDSGSTPAMAREIAAEISGARCVIVPGLQHMGLLEHPPPFTHELLTFLRSTLCKETS